MRLCLASGCDGEAVKHAATHLLCYAIEKHKKFCAAESWLNAGFACTGEADAIERRHPPRRPDPAPRHRGT